MSGESMRSTMHQSDSKKKTVPHCQGKISATKKINQPIQNSELNDARFARPNSPRRALLAALVRGREIESLAVFGVSAALERRQFAGGLLLGELVGSREVDVDTPRVAAVFSPAEG